MKNLHRIAVVIGLGMLAGCSLDPVDRSGNITIRIEAPKRSVSNALTAATFTAPTSVSAFSCIGINVIGPGIPDTSRNPEPNLGPLFDRLLRRESYCSYRGIIKGPLSTAVTTEQEISLVVPPGAPRLIQVIGIIEQNGSNDCQAEFIPGVLPPLDGNGHPIEGDAYELGRAVIDLFQDQTVSITMDYDSLATDADRALREIQCGNNAPPATTVLSPTVLSQPDTPVAHVSTGGAHVCGIFGSSGTVYCRGSNSMGQLGNGTFVDSPSFVATSVTNATMVATGNAFSCALLTGGTVKCWGAGLVGQLGDNNGTNSSTPVLVAGISTAASIAAGGSHACARTSASDLYCWGLNTSGQLGDTSTTDRNAPVFISPLSTQTLAVSLGQNHSCAALAAGIKCWGSGGFGQLGMGNTSSLNTPTAVPGIAVSIASLAAGENHTCAIYGGSLNCWGKNDLGQLGDGTTANVLSPAVIGVATPSTVTAGKGFSCAKDGSSNLHCWGVGPLLGNGTTAGSLNPVLVSAFSSNVSQVYPASVSGTVCVKLGDGSVKCWGDNQSGQISP